jgi:glucosamine-6-phosphate deaminase
VHVIICESPSTAAAAAAKRVGAALRQRPDATLGVATGSSPLGVYEALGEGVGVDGTDWARVRAFALDEYVDIRSDHPERYTHVVDREVAQRLGLTPEHVSVPDGSADDLDAAARAYEASIVDAGGIDAQILGIGMNGHIGFNEPGSSLASRTRVVALTEATRAANARFFDSPSEVPTRALTQGVGTIMEARAIVLVAQGEAKAEAIRQVVEGPVSSRWPGSALQMHPDVTVVLDEAAASRLELRDEYLAAELVLAS